jgi:hypothetical protein
MQGAIFFDEIEHPFHQSVLLEVGKNAEGDSIAAEMRLVICVAAGTAKRALPRNFNGQQRLSTAENCGPGMEQFLSLQDISSEAGKYWLLLSTFADA